MGWLQKYNKGVYSEAVWFLEELSTPHHVPHHVFYKYHVYINTLHPKSKHMHTHSDCILKKTFFLNPSNIMQNLKPLQRQNKKWNTH